ncbi:hypothetical protein AURDEDRAFT_188689 [Auricularia subglabra TFB-10046 SS5]|uniref:Uncharacterized protein n=1 Tax=Auricularia subglabra (strain TFB-10046 / SS5) TaxID=717982 RepID=J0LF14_AURST|nr:hypothetical protein AURDEDRAFT_188689 [Auricularia subglabra TFB-10046 SS5]
MAPPGHLKTHPLRSNRSITDFFQRKSSVAPSAPSSSPAPAPAQPSRPPTASGSRVATTQPAQSSKAATRVVKRQQDSSPIPLEPPSFVHLRMNKKAAEIIEISDKSHISISSGSPSPRPLKRSLFPKNGAVLDLTTPEPPVFRPRTAKPASNTPIIISSSSESRATNIAPFKRNFLSDNDSDVQIIHQPPLKRQKTASVQPKPAPKQRPVPPGPPPSSSSPRNYSPFSKTQRRPSLLQPLPATSSEDEGALPYSPFVQRQQTAVANNARRPLSSSNMNQRSSNNLVKRQPVRSPSGPRSQNASPAQLSRRPTTTPLRKRPAPRVVEDEDSDVAMDLGIPMDDFPPVDDFLPDLAPMDGVDKQPQASTSKAPSPLVRLPSGTPRTPEQGAVRTNTSKNSQPRASGSSTSRRVTPQSSKRPSPAQQRPTTAADLLRSIEAGVDSGSSSDSELDYEQLMAETAIHASSSDSPPRGARRRVASDVESMASEHMIDRATEDESPRAARHRARAVVPSGGESARSGTENASTEEVSDSEPEGHMPRFAPPARASTAGNAGHPPLPPLSAFSSLTSLASGVGSPPPASRPNFPSSAFGSPLTELGSPSSRAVSARTADAHTTPVQTRARYADAKSPTPSGTPRRVLEVVVPPVAAVSRAGLRRYNTASAQQTKLDVGASSSRGERLAKRNATQQKSAAAPAKPDGGFFIEQLLKERRKKEEGAEVEAAAAAINEQHRAEALRIRDHTRRQEERALNGLSPSSPERVGADSDEELLDMKAMEQDSRLLLDSEGQRTFATLAQAVGEDEEAGWCARVGDSPFWETVATPGAASAEPVCPLFADETACPSLARAVQDPRLLAVFLNVGVLPANESVVTWLFETAMLPDDTLSSAAFDRLQSLLRKRDGNFQLSTSVLLKPFIRFGATREAMDAIDPALYDTVEGPNYPPDAKRRDEAMRNWLTAVTELARSGHLVRAETPKLALAIILLALDAPSSRPLFTLAMTTLEHVCAQVLRGSEDVHLELDICRTIWLWAEGAELPVQARILDVVRGGRCLAYLGRWLAHAFLTGLDLRNMDTATYADLPPLDGLIPLVTFTRPPKDGSQTPDGPAPFVISPETDYVAMGHSADLLARTLTSTRDYLTSTARAAKWICDLQQIETNLARLAGQIPGGPKGGILAAAGVQQNLESTRLRLAAELQVFKPRQRNVLEYLSSPKKDGSDDDDGSASEQD